MGQTGSFLLQGSGLRPNLTPPTPPFKGSTGCEPHSHQCPESQGARRFAPESVICVPLRLHSLPLPLPVQAAAAHRCVCVCVCMCMCMCVCVHSYVHMYDVSHLGAVSLSFEALTGSV